MHTDPFRALLVSTKATIQPNPTAATPTNSTSTSLASNSTTRPPTTISPETKSGSITPTTEMQIETKLEAKEEEMTTNSETVIKTDVPDSKFAEDSKLSKNVATQPASMKRWTSGEDSKSVVSALQILSGVYLLGQTSTLTVSSLKRV
jgi:hypothetical protein